MPPRTFKNSKFSVPLGTSHLTQTPLSNIGWVCGTNTSRQIQLEDSGFEWSPENTRATFFTLRRAFVKPSFEKTTTADLLDMTVSTAPFIASPSTTGGLLYGKTSSTSSTTAPSVRRRQQRATLGFHLCPCRSRIAQTNALTPNSW